RRVLFRSCPRHEQRVDFARAKVRNRARLEGDAAAAGHGPALGRCQQRLVERLLAALAQRPVCSVEDRGRARDVEQLEAGIDNKGDPMHWQKLPYVCHFCQSEPLLASTPMEATDREGGASDLNRWRKP